MRPVSQQRVILVTGIVGSFGTDVIAGYGIASRLDYVLIPMLFVLSRSHPELLAFGTKELFIWPMESVYRVHRRLGFATGQ